MKERLALLARQLKSSPSPGAVQQIGEELEKLAEQMSHSETKTESKKS